MVSALPESAMKKLLPLVLLSGCLFTADRVDAKYTDGLLTLTLPKTEEAKQKVIDVKVK